MYIKCYIRLILIINKQICLDLRVREACLVAPGKQVALPYGPGKQVAL